MKKKAIRMLLNQVEKLQAADFDLEAWKGATIAVLSRLFGKETIRITQIAALRIDYSSWAQRDSNSSYKPLESSKRIGREILMTAIEEIENFGFSASKEEILAPFFTEAEIRLLLSDDQAEKESLIRKLKKEQLQMVLLRLL